MAGLMVDAEDMEDIMAIRLSGMNSGLDTDSIVKHLYRAIQPRKKNMKKHRQKAWLEARNPGDH